jgi:hypothetical protein
MVGIVKRVGKSENPRYAICTRQALLKLLQVGPTGELSPAHALHYLSPCDKDGLFDFGLRCTSGVIVCAGAHLDSQPLPLSKESAVDHH